MEGAKEGPPRRSELQGQGGLVLIVGQGTRTDAGRKIHRLKPAPQEQRGLTGGALSSTVLSGYENTFCRFRRVAIL